jgi:hypothetical protein
MYDAVDGGKVDDDFLSGDNIDDGVYDSFNDSIARKTLKCA